jgi:hypothetical protein
LYSFFLNNGDTTQVCFFVVPLRLTFYYSRERLRRAAVAASDIVRRVLVGHVVGHVV